MRCPEKTPRWLLPVAIGLLFLNIALASNPYLTPAFYDNLTYYLGAQSILELGEYSFNGEIISDWPPFFSAFLALGFSVFGSSIVVAKLLSGLWAPVAVFLAWKVLAKERRREPALTAAVLALLPTCLTLATRVSSDWIHAALCFLFLLILESLRTKRSWTIATLAGIVLGCAALTRLPAILLAVPIVFQWFRIVLSDPSSSITARFSKGIPEVITAIIGAGLWGSWMLYLIRMRELGRVSVGNYEKDGFSLFTKFDPLSLAESVFDLFLQWLNLAAAIGPVSYVFLTVATVALVAGAVSTIRREGFRASDAFVVASLLLFVVYHWKLGRYSLPIAPFLISYMLEGIRLTAGVLAKWMGSSAFAPRIFTATVAGWFFVSLSLSSLVLFNGRISDNNGPLCRWMLDSPQDYYKNYWLELYETCEKIRRSDIDTIGSVGYFERYAVAWADRSVVFILPSEVAEAPGSVDALLIRSDLSAEDVKTPGWESWIERDTVRVLRPVGSADDRP